MLSLLHYGDLTLKCVFNEDFVRDGKFTRIQIYVAIRSAKRYHLKTFKTEISVSRKMKRQSGSFLNCLSQLQNV
jgi:hypothetical protein